MIVRSPEALKRAIPELLRVAGDELTSFCQTLLTELLQHLRAIEERVHLIETSIQAFVKHSALRKEIAAVLGVGLIVRHPLDIIASTLASSAANN